MRTSEAVTTRPGIGLQLAGTIAVYVLLASRARSCCCCSPGGREERGRRDRHVSAIEPRGRASCWRSASGSPCTSCSAAPTSAAACGTSSRGVRAHERERALIADAIGPVWEANHVWLIFVVTALLRGLPPGLRRPRRRAVSCRSASRVAGIVFRGAAFAFRSHGEAAGVAATVDARLRHRLARDAGRAGHGAARLSRRAASGCRRTARSRPACGARGPRPLSIVAGALALAMCAYLAAVYLTVEAVHAATPSSTATSAVGRWSPAIVAGVLAAAGLVLVHSTRPCCGRGCESPAPLRGPVGDRGHRLPDVRTDPPLPARSGRSGRRRRLRPVRLGRGAMAVPHRARRDRDPAAAPDATLRVVVVGFAIGGAVLAPSLFLLFRIFKGEPFTDLR